MIYKKMIVMIVLITIVIGGVVSSSDSDLIELTDEEILWIEEHEEIIYAGDPNWAPIDFQNEDGEPDGLAVDFVDLIGQKTGIKFTKVNVGNWDETVIALKNKEVDVIAASYHQSRVDYMFFSPELYRIPYIYIIRNDADQIVYDELTDYRVASVEGWILNEILKENHPGIELIEYPTIKDALRAVSFGNVDVLVQEIASVSHAIEKENITNLKIGGEYPKSVSLHMAIRNDYEVLYNIMTKAINDITVTEKDRIVSKWIGLAFESFYKSSEFKIMVATVLAIVLLILLWNYSLRKSVQKKTKELSSELKIKDAIKSQLEDSLETLKHTQREMLNQEKLASLGSMIAGITHEVSNPMAISLTTVSAMKSRIDVFNKIYLSHKMTKSDLEQFIEFTNDCSEMLLDNVDISIKLLMKFKTMAINQMYEEKTTFDVGESIRTLCDNMKYELKKKQITTHVISDQSILLKNNIGAFLQIFTNLLMNSIIHGFNDISKDNLVTIEVIDTHEYITIKYADNGVGIPPDAIDNIFKLFYTTKREDGGSGLGLHIVNNLLKNEFNGSVECESEVGKGVLFTLKFHKHSQEKKE